MSSESQNVKSIVIIAGHRLPNVPRTVNPIIDNLVKAVQSGGGAVASVGTDQGIGALVKSVCLYHNVPFIDVHARILGIVPKSLIHEIFCARYSLLLTLGDAFHLFLSKDRVGLIEVLVNRVNESGKTSVLYNYDGEVIGDAKA